MSWTKSDYEGRVCWEQNGKRIFDTADIEKLETGHNDKTLESYKGDAHIALFILIFMIGVIVGIAISDMAL